MRTILATEEFQESLEHCIGLFALSEYHAQFLRESTGKPVSVLYHPTEIPKKLFSFDKFISNENKKIINIGYWLRKLNSIYQLPINTNYEKWRLIPYSTSRPKEAIDKLIQKEQQVSSISKDSYFGNTKDVSRVSDYEYDVLLSENVVFLDLYDSSANNAVIECIARGTPLLVNPLPAVVEYLGTDYPLYFDSLEEAANKVQNFEVVQHAHEYLMKCEGREKLTQKHFRESFMQSEVYNLV